MFLRGVRIENFRAIRKTTIGFDEGTVLIGENDCGISSVLDALEKTPKYKQFMLDGGSVMLEDYMSVRPENRERLIKLNGHEAIVEDHSTYGTFLNGTRIEGSAPLAAGDRLRLGTPGIVLQLIAVD